ncbi:unnamed protein product [Phytophthora fragariaefolia]|uniref:ATP-dependent DNA helicase n=1 Tax=Phytophthora fragariaefolia TaxID=1490495 RepID=A0A9W6XQF9_9STRA|nr:unnamed protein product [Phytophthora fragariaefolia]
MMVECNPFAQQFLSFGQKLREDLARGMQVKDIRYVLHSKPSEPITYNLPTVSEVGVAMVEDGNLTRPRDLYVVAKDHSLLRLFETDEKYDPLQYPLLFPYGDLGWTYTDVYANGAKYRNKRRMSLREHVAYRLFQKVDDQAALHQGGRLFQQWVVDQRAKCEQEQLRWVAKNQKKLRAELYHGISDALLNEETITLDEGEVLVSEYDRATGTLVHPDRGSGYEHFLNQVGKPLFFQTHTQGVLGTCTSTIRNPWLSCGMLLPDDQTAQDRPDIVARVWQLKLKAKLADLDEGLLGRLEARIYVVEFQKRGLPHAHIVIIVAEEDKPRTREIIEKLVSAEVPDKEANPDLYETVMTCMMHGLCGPANPDSPCMKGGKCTKGFPKPLLEVTQANLDGFPLYRRRRREPGVLIFKDRQYDNETVNQWVVPYNAYLCQKYDCHINVEVCTTIGAIKYLSKYVYKGSDMAVLTIEAARDPSEPRSEPNEILRFLNARYISPVEAAMRILTYEIQGKTHAVTTLTVHLEGGQMVVFQPNDDPDRVLGRAVVLSGDFRQILPVVVRGTPAETIDACLKSSHLWSHFRQVHLTENMRVRAAHSAETAADLAAFSEFLLQVGEGRHEVNRQLGRDYIKLPRSMLIDDPPEEEVDADEVIAPGAIPSGLKRLIDVMYPDVNNQAIATDEYFANRTILTTTNVMVHRINDAVAARLDARDPGFGEH